MDHSPGPTRVHPAQLGYTYVKGIKYSNIEKKIHKHLICDIVGVKSEVRQNKWLKNVWLSKM